MNLLLSRERKLFWTDCDDDIRIGRRRGSSRQRDGEPLCRDVDGDVDCKCCGQDCESFHKRSQSRVPIHALERKEKIRTQHGVLNRNHPQRLGMTKSFVRRTKSDRHHVKKRNVVQRENDMRAEGWCDAVKEEPEDQRQSDGADSESNRVDRVADRTARRRRRNSSAFPPAVASRACEGLPARPGAALFPAKIRRREAR